MSIASGIPVHQMPVIFIAMQKPREHTECQSIYYQIWHDAMICGTGLMLVKTRRGVSRSWTKTEPGTGPTCFGQYPGWHLNADAFTMWHHIAPEHGETFRNVGCAEKPFKGTIIYGRYCVDYTQTNYLLIGFKSLMFMLVSEQTENWISPWIYYLSQNRHRFLDYLSKLQSIIVLHIKFKHSVWMWYVQTDPDPYGTNILQKMVQIVKEELRNKAFIVPYWRSTR